MLSAVKRVAQGAAKARQLSTIQKINLTFIDTAGNRTKVFGIPGETLLDTTVRNKIPLEGPCRGGAGPIEMKRTEKWTETTFGEGLGCFYCHVKIPIAFQNVLPDRQVDEREGLSSTWEEEYSETTSRLACQITLDKRHEGMVVFVPDAPVVEFC